MSVHRNNNNKQINSSRGHPHDLFFRRLFSGNKELIALLKTILPQSILYLLDLSTLKIENSIAIKSLEIRVDLILTVKLKKSKKETDILFIVDHKSWPERRVIQQLLKYQLIMMEKHYDDDEDFLPPVLTIIFYHGHKKWNPLFSLHEDWVSRGVFSKRGLEQISQYLINFTPYFFNLSEFDIENKAIKRIRPILYTFKQIWSLNKLKSLKEKKAALHKILSSVKKDLQGEEKEYIINVLLGIKSYLLQYNPELAKGLLNEVSKEITEELGGENIMKELDLAIAEIVQKNCQAWEQEGLQKGMQEGIQKGMQEGRQKGMQEGRQKERQEVILKLLKADMSVEKVSEITGLSKQEIRNFQEEPINKSDN